MNLPDITIVIPSYNCARFVCDAIDSVLSQTIGACQIIVVDDGSTDSTAEVVSDYVRDHRIKVVVQSNRGLPAARNAGARLCQTKYIGFLDADDRLAPTALEIMRNALDSSGASWCLVDVLKAHADREEVHRIELPERNLLYGILENDFVCRGMFFRYEHFVKVGMYDESIRNREDWDLNIRMIEMGMCFCYVREPLYIYIWRSGSITTGNVRRLLGYTRSVMRKHHKRLADTGDRIAAQIYAYNMWDLGRRYWYECGDCWSALACIYESQRYEFNVSRLLHPIVQQAQQARKKLESAWTT
jgi:glycosyltransferase involved in cell wall biosynthesis